MPLFRAAQKLVYYAHVPKTAGTTIEKYLTQRFGPLDFLDPKFGALSEDARWSKTSPQHMPEDARIRVLPDTFIDASFATVRHPATRLRSAFLFQREIAHKIPEGTEFLAWLSENAATLAQDPYAYDGHMRPMSATVPPQAQAFAIEAGMAPIIRWLDTLTDTHDAQTQMIPHNVLAKRLIHQKSLPVQVELDDEALEQIAMIYAEDYSRFGYDVAPPIQEPFT